MLDPFHYPIPKAFLREQDLRAWAVYLHKWLQQSYVQQGGSNNTVESTIIRDAFDSTMHVSFTDALTKRLDSLEQDAYYQDQPVVRELVTKTISRETFTATDFMFVNMTNNSTLKLPENPVQNSIVVFTKDSTNSTVSGNGRKLNGTKKDIVFRKSRLARQIHYFIDVDEWFFI